MKITTQLKAILLSTFLATFVPGAGHADTYTYTRSNAGETTDLLSGMSIDQSNFVGGTFGTTAANYSAINFSDHKAGTTGLQLLFSIPTGAYRFDIPQGVNAYYGIKWVAPNGEVFTNLNFSLFDSCNDMPFQGSAYAVSGGVPTLLGSWGLGGVTPTNGGNFSFSREQKVTEIRVYALDARLGTTGNDQPYPNVFRAWNDNTVGVSLIQVSTTPAIYTYTRSSAGEITDLMPGMSIDQSNFAGGTFGTTATTYPAVNFNNYKAGTLGVQLIFSPIPDPYRIDIPQGVNAYYGIKWVVPNGGVFTNLNFSLFNYGANDMPFKGSAYSVSNGAPTLLGSWGNGGVTPTNGGSFNFTMAQNVTEIRVYALDARLGTTGNDQPYPNFFRAWNGDGVGIASIQVATAITPAFQCAAISPMVKLRRNQSAMTETNGVAGTNMISVVAARGEGQSAQVLVSALRAFTNGLVSFTSLTGPGGATITPEWRVADYVHVTRPTAMGYGVAGYYPDPLVDLKPFSLQAGESQSVWMDVWVPRAAVPGTYTGTVTISGGIGMAVTLPVNLTVKNVLLPVTARLDTLVQFLNSRISRTPADYNALCEMGLKYRFTSAPNLQWDAVFSTNALGVWQADWTALDAEVERFLALGSTQFKIEWLPWSTNAPTGAQSNEWNAKLNLTSQHLRANGWMDKFLIYIFDEPNASMTNNLNNLCGFIHARDPEFRILYSNGNNVWTINADIYVTHIHLWENAGVAAMESKRQAGCELWTYTTLGTATISEPDTWKIDWRGTGARALGWWLWMRQADGYLYWSLDGWASDPYNTPDPIPGCNGDGFMFYPDSQGYPGVPSLRLSLMRDALQDNDLLAMLKGKIGANAALMAQYGSLLTTTNAFPVTSEYLDDPAMYEQRHTDLLNALDTLSSDLRADAAVAGTAYSSSIANSSSSTNGYTAPLTYVKLSGPGWLNVATNGALTGLPTGGAGVSVWSVHVTDSFGGSNIASLTITIYPTNNYGTLVGNSTASGYINRVQIGNLNNTSGNNNGYANFRNLIAQLNPGQTASYALTPGGNGVNTMAWTIWIDFNGDGDFADSGERVVTTAASKSARSGSFTVPATAAVGPSRMRIAMIRSSSARTSPTGSFSLGEVEDYSVQIGTNAVQNLMSSPINVLVLPVPPTLNWTNLGGGQLQFSWIGGGVLQWQTNSLSTGFGTNWVNYPGGGTSPVSIAINPAPSSVFFRVQVPQP